MGLPPQLPDPLGHFDGPGTPRGLNPVSPLSAGTQGAVVSPSPLNERSEFCNFSGSPPPGSPAGHPPPSGSRAPGRRGAGGGLYKVRSCYSAEVDRVRELVYHVLEDTDVPVGAERGANIRFVVGIVILATILLSLACSTLESMPEFDDTPEATWRAFEIVTNTVFTVEYVLRFWVCDIYGTSHITWAVRWINLCDLVSILPTYLDMISKSDSIKALRALRVFRLFKLGRYLKGLQVMIAALTNSLSALYILFLLILVGMLLFASAVYFTERLACPDFHVSHAYDLQAFLEYNSLCSVEGVTRAPPYGGCCVYHCTGLAMGDASPFRLCLYGTPLVADGVGAVSVADWEVNALYDIVFESIPESMWWAGVTMTTVGFGDLVPQNWVSKVLASLAMVSGLLIIAMPFAIVGAKLGEAMTIYADSAEAEAKKLTRTLIAQGRTKTFVEDGSEFAKMVRGDYLNILRADLRDSAICKKQIVELEALRDNLWTSIEHSMSVLAYEGFTSIGADLLSEQPPGARFYASPGDEQKDDDCEWSCYVFSRKNFIRRQAMRLTKSKLFDWLVILSILLNSAILMMQNYEPHPPGVIPWENHLQDSTDSFFTIFFTFECAVKIVAQGFFVHERSYLRDSWNWLDFVVVVGGLASLTMTGTGSLSFIRTIRVLRPLRTFSAMPGLRNLFNTILLSLPRLRDVVLMALFLMTTFGILGLHLFGGVLHRSCRLTPTPLHFTQRAAADGCVGLCFDAQGGLGVQSSAIFDAFCAPVERCNSTYWAGGDYHIWPLDPNQADRFCHEYVCVESTALWELLPGLTAAELSAQVLAPLKISVSASGGASTTVCGSELDADLMYAPRLALPALQGINMNDYNANNENANYNWGFTTFDSLCWSLFIVFQSATLEGWTSIMYMVQDASSNVLGFMYFVSLVIIGSFFLLNVVLAIVWDAFMDIKEQDEAEALAAAMKKQKTMQSGVRFSTEALGQPKQDAEAGAGIAPGAALAAKRVARRGSMLLPRTFRLKLEACLDACAGLLVRRNSVDIDRKLVEYHPWRIVRWARRVAANEAFQMFIIAIITLNVVVLSMDRYPQPLGPKKVVNTAGTLFNAIFIVELVVMHLAVLPLVYWGDNTLAFDGVIVLISIFEYIDFNGSAPGDGNNASSSVTALRAFRLLRIVKLAKKFKGMRILLKASIATLLGMRDFVLLLFLIICVFALVGQSFFGGTFMFDGDGKLVKWASYEEFEAKCPIDGNKPSCVPRAHFDTFLWAFTTIFQILTGENWNSVMYDGMKATAWYAFFFFWMVMLFGNFVVLNLFLAYLMYNFDAEQDRIKGMESSKAASRANMLTRMVSRMWGMSEKAKSSIKSFGTDAAIGSRPGAWDDDNGEEDAQKSPSFPQTSTSGRRGDLYLDQVVPLETTSMTSDTSRRKDVCLVSGLSDFSEVPDAGANAEVSEQRLEARSSGRVRTVSVVAEDTFSSPSQDEPEEPDSQRQPTKEMTANTSAYVRNSEAALAFIGAVRAASSVAVSSVAVVGRQASRRPSMRESDMPSIEVLMPSTWKSSALFTSFRKRSCFLFPEGFPVRKLCLRLVTSPYFDHLIISLIVLSSLLMMFQNPLNNPDGYVEFATFVANVVFTIIFTLEMLMKCMAFGVFCGQPGRPAYLQSSWNMMDALIVATSLADVVDRLAAPDPSRHLAFMKIFRIARMLRPLRIISRNENLKVVVKTIGASMPQLRILLVFSLLFFLIFALLGVSMFKGSFYTCQSVGTLEDHEYSRGNATTPLCIWPATAEQYGLRFAKPRPEEGCENGSEDWSRVSADTPICEVRCDGENAQNHSFCQNQFPWGYHIMRCTDCRDAFCPGGHDAGCRRECADPTDHDYFCMNMTIENFSSCVDECEAECACSDSCRGLVADAALCVEQEGMWRNRHQHFDTLEQGIISLFEICTTEGWVDLMLASVDSIGPYRQPQRDANEWLGCTMFIAFILLGSFFVLNLCVGVIIDNYANVKSQKGRLLITETQSLWLDYQKALYLHRRFFPQTNLHTLSPTRSHLIRIVTSFWFERSIMFCIIVNTMTLGMDAYPSPGKQYDELLDTCNSVFTFIFNLEAAVKILAMQRSYFKESWNLFDFFCVFVSDAFVVFDTLDGPEQNNSSFATVMSAVRVFRIARLFRLVRFLKGVNQLFLAMLLSIPKLFNVAAIMLLLVYLYAVLGINLFATVAFPVGGQYSTSANFRTFPNAVSLLLRAMTGESWNEVMHDLANSKFDFQSYMGVVCKDDLDMAEVAKSMGVDAVVREDLYFLRGPDWEPNDCGSPVAFVYFVTYTIVVTFVILNLFIAVIFEGFEESRNSEIAELISTCTDVWKRYDPDRRLYVHIDKVFDFIDECVEHLCKMHGKEFSSDFTMQPRWDTSYDSYTQAPGASLASYSLRYVQINGVTMNHQHQVRLVVAVRAVIRRMLCNGGLNSRLVTDAERHQRMKEMQAMCDVMEDPPKDLEKELSKLQRLEARQARSLKPAKAPSMAARISLFAPKKSVECSSTEPEIEFVRDVAAAKLQHHLREKAKRIRARRALDRSIDSRVAASPAPSCSFDVRGE